MLKYCIYRYNILITYNKLGVIAFAGYCIQRDTLRSICNQIRVETPLYTLVKGKYQLSTSCLQTLADSNQPTILLPLDETNHSILLHFQSSCTHFTFYFPEPSSPTRCPFHDAYYFNYNDLVSGFCEQPISYAKPCVGHNKFLFHFKHCDELAAWNGRGKDPIV